MTREEAIRYLQPIADNATLPNYAESLSMAIDALIERQERDRGCEYCAKYDDPCEIPMIAKEDSEPDRGIYLDNGSLCADGGEFCEAKVNYCPVCGRRLE